MTALTTTFKGIRNARRKFRRLEIRLTNTHARKGARRGAAIVRDELKARVPQDSGQLRKGIRSVGRRGRKSYAKASVFIKGEAAERTGAFWWYYVERGAENVDATRFIEEGTRRTYNRVVRTVLRTVDGGLRQDLI